MKMKKEYLILAVIVVALVAYLVFHSSDRSSYELPSMPDVAGDTISKIEITKAGKTVIVTKKDGKWYVGPKAYPADEAKIKDMVELIQTVTHTALVSESKNYERYDLTDDTKITVKAWTGEKLVRHMEIGKEASTYHHTFTKIPGDFRVYQTTGSYESKFDQDADELRDKVIMAFDKKEIKKIEVFKDKEWITLTRVDGTDKEQAAWEDAEGKRADSTKIGELLNIISDMSGEEYIEDKTKEDLKDPIYIYKMTGKKVYTLSIFAKEDKESKKYPSISSENDYPFTLHEYDVNRMKEKLEPEEKEKETTS